MFICTAYDGMHRDLVITNASGWLHEDLVSPQAIGCGANGIGEGGDINNMLCM